jgi:hypothetical protein
VYGGPVHGYVAHPAPAFHGAVGGGFHGSVGGGFHGAVGGGFHGGRR